MIATSSLLVATSSLSMIDSSIVVMWFSYGFSYGLGLGLSFAFTIFCTYYLVKFIFMLFMKFVFKYSDDEILDYLYDTSL